MTCKTNEKEKKSAYMKKAIVTGGTKGIGLAIVKELLFQEYDVIVTYSSDVENALNVERILSESYKERVRIIRRPMEQYEDIRTFIEECEKEKILESGVDAVILNAGCTDRTNWSNLSWEQWNHVMNVNLNAPAALVHDLDKYLNKKAAIIFIGSEMSIFPHATSVPYTVSKAAVNGLTKALVKEFAEREIRVNAILPGFVDTPWQKDKPEDQRKRICDKVALHRFAEPEEIAEIVMDVVRSTYINGALIQVDGGYCYR